MLISKWVPWIKRGKTPFVLNYKLSSIRYATLSSRCSNFTPLNIIWLCFHYWKYHCFTLLARPSYLLKLWCPFALWLFLSDFLGDLPFLVRLLSFQRMHSFFKIIFPFFNLHSFLLFSFRLLLRCTLVGDILIELATCNNFDLNQRLRKFVQSMEDNLC